MKLTGTERSTNDRHATLRSIPLFAELDDDALALLEASLTPVTLGAGKRMTTQGAAGREFAIILEGLAAVVRDGVELQRLGPHSFFGEHALLHDRPRTAEVLALTPMRLLVANTGEFRQLMRKLPIVAERVLIEDRARQITTVDLREGPTDAR